MEQGSPPTRRVVDILHHLAKVQNAQTVTEIAASLDIPRATASAIVNELEIAGWVQAKEKRRFALGVAMANLSSKASSNPRDALLDTLANDAECGVTLCAIEPGAVTVLSRHGDERTLSGFSIGSHLPLLYPAGASVMPWRPDEELVSWLNPVSDLAQAKKLLSLVRKQGVAVFRPSSADLPLMDLLAELLSDVSVENVKPSLRQRAITQLVKLSSQPYVQADLDNREPLPLSYLTAPVRQENGVANFEIQLGLLRTAVSHEERNRCIQLIREAAQELSLLQIPSVK